ncbi:hypothetical protein ACIQAC_05600 [Streptomyces sp. NPDC088387]|uniref:hypothetical protein n=1 Tax=Streptomyces sp. NPDC088387 TaxID=3365859 RepID=UPI003815C714
MRENVVRKDSEHISSRQGSGGVLTACALSAALVVAATCTGNGDGAQGSAPGGELFLEPVLTQVQDPFAPPGDGSADSGRSVTPMDADTERDWRLIPSTEDTESLSEEPAADGAALPGEQAVDGDTAVPGEPTVDEVGGLDESRLYEPGFSRPAVEDPALEESGTADDSLDPGATDEIGPERVPELPDPPDGGGLIPDDPDELDDARSVLGTPVELD